MRAADITVTSYRRALLAFRSFILERAARAGRGAGEANECSAAPGAAAAACAA